MINNSRNRWRVQLSIDLLQQTSDEYQNIIDNIDTCEQLPENLSIRQLLSISRTADAMERVLGELHALLDHPPSVGGQGPLRPLPSPVRAVDGIAKPGVAVPAAGDGGPAAA